MAACSILPFQGPGVKKTFRRLFADTLLQFVSSRAAAFGILAVLNTSPESDHRRLLVHLFTQLVYLFVFLGGAPHKGRVLAASPSPAQSEAGNHSLRLETTVWGWQP